MDYSFLHHNNRMNFAKRKKFQWIFAIFSVFIVIIFIYTGIGFNDKIKSNKFDNPLFAMIDYEHSHLEFDSANSNNVTGFNEYIVPDIVHYIQLENPFFDFITLISIMSTVRHHKPKLIMIHSDRKKLRGKYWQKIIELNSSKMINTRIYLNKIPRPRYIFDRKLSSIYHASDIARFRVLRKYGGIYLDNDVYVVKPLHKFRRYEFVIGWPENQYLGTQVLICHKNARFLRLWYDSYHNYKADLWYYNAGEFPTKHILESSPNLVHRVRNEFGVDNLVEMLYNQMNPHWQAQYYTIHLLERHRSYLVPNKSDGNRFRYFNEYNIGNYNRTFGEMARLAYFGEKKILDPIKK
nr:uncharacterized protein LOC124495637 [Dermatophagoides farinae]